MSINVYRSIATFVILVLTSGTVAAQSNMESSGDNADVDVYGLSLGMTPDQIAAVLQAKHPSISYRQQDIPCPGTTTICIKRIKAVVEEGLTADDSYTIDVSLTKQLPFDPENYSADSISFRHKHDVLGFSVHDLFQENYGHLGTVKRDGPRGERGKVLGFTYQDQPASLTYEYRRSKGYNMSYYRITLGVPRSRSHWNALMEKAEQSVPKSEKPF